MRVRRVLRLLPLCSVIYEMAANFCQLALVFVAVSAAPPASPRLYQQHAQSQLQQVNPLDYYLDNPDVVNYYAQQKQDTVRHGHNGAPSRLENLDPNTEVELLPGAQQPVQPPQQIPNIPGLLPGQRVFIVHMAVPGYRPGTISGYQPVYIVAAAPQGNPGFPGNVPGYQNAVLLDLPRQAAISPVLDYPRATGIQVPNTGLPLGAPLTLNRPFNLVYPDPSVAYQSAQPQSPEGAKGSVRLSQLIALQGLQAQNVNNPRTTSNEAQTKTEQNHSTGSNDSNETKDEEPKRNTRPVPPHAQRKP